MSSEKELHQDEPNDAEEHSEREDDATEKGEAVKVRVIKDADEEQVDPEEEEAEDAAATQEVDLLDKAQKEAQEHYDKYLRAMAELENFKKRSIKERGDLLKYAGEHLVRDIIDVVDDFERALSQDVSGVSDEFLKGVQMIHERLLSTLDRHGVKGEAALGQDFDPNKLEALASVPTAEHAPGKVLEEFKKPYFFKDKLIRPGQVVVSAALDSGQKQQDGGAEEGPEETDE